MLAHLKITRNHNKYLKVWRGERTQLLSWTETKMFDKSEFYRLRQMEEGFIGKWRRIPGSGRAEDVCWDRQGHRRVVCTSYTILNNTQLHNLLLYNAPKKSTYSTLCTVHCIHTRLHWNSTFLMHLQSQSQTTLPIHSYKLHMLHICEHWKTDSLSFHMAHMCNCERVETPLTDAVHWGVV